MDEYSLEESIVVVLGGCLLGPILCPLLVYAADESTTKRSDYVGTFLFGPGLGLMLAWQVVKMRRDLEVNNLWTLLSCGYTILYWLGVIWAAIKLFTPVFVPR